MGKIEYNKTHNKLIEIEPINKAGISNKFYFDFGAGGVPITLEDTRNLVSSYGK